jgi:hypothetical protein
MQQPDAENEILVDALMTVNSITEHYNASANECVHEAVKDAILECLNRERAIQKEVSHLMQSKGYNCVPAAERDKVEEIKKRYSQSAQIL